MKCDVKGRVKRHFPIFQWIQFYTIQKAICDLIAGITVGLTLIPQSIAYAALAGLGPQYGLYSSLLGGLLYTIFGTVPDLNIAPTALISLLTYSYTHDSNFGIIPAAILLCFISGAVEITCGLLNLGFLVDFVSGPVVSAFTSAGALTIAASQLKDALGLHFKADTFVTTIYHVSLNVGQTQFCDAGLSVACCIFLISFRELKRCGEPPNFNDKKADEVATSKWKTAIWFISVARNAFTVIFCASMAYLLKSNDQTPFTLTRAVPEGLPSWKSPFNVGNSTEIGAQSDGLLDLIKELGSGMLVVPFVAILSNVAIAKSFAGGQVVDASQEMLAVGLCNLLGSFLGSYPVNASFSRAAVNHASGARTTFGGIYTGALVVLALTFLTPYFSFIPKATLASVVICAVIYMVDLGTTKNIWRTNRIDFFPYFVTLIACLSLSIEIGIVLGVLTDLLLVLYYTARPKVEVERVTNGNVNYLNVTLLGILGFSSAEYTRECVLKGFKTHSNLSNIIVFDCSKLRKVDYTVIKCVESLISDLEYENATIIFYLLRIKLKEMLSDGLAKRCTFINVPSDLEEKFKECHRAREINGNANEAFEVELDEIELKSVSSR